MSDEELIRRAFERYNRFGFSGYAEVLAEDVVWHAPSEYPEGDVWRGRDVVTQAWQEQWESVFSELRAEVTELTQGPKAWLVGVLASGRAVSSGMPLEWPGFFVVRIAGGAMEEVWVLLDRADARRAAGLDAE